MALLLNFCLILIVSSAIASGILTVLSIIAIFPVDAKSEEIVEKAKTAFYIYSFICFLNMVLIFVLTLPEKGLHFDYPKTLLVGSVLEVAFLAYICRTATKDIKIEKD